MDHNNKLLSSTTPGKKSQSSTNVPFPLLKNKDILQHMSDFGFGLSERELLEPNKHKERLRTIFQEVLQHIYGLSREFKASPNFKSVQQTMDYPELLDDAASEITFFKHMCKLMKLCGIRDFGFKDLVSPSKSRLRIQLSGIINLCLFYRDQSEMYKETIDQRDVLIEELSSLELQYRDMQLKKEETKQAAANRSKEIQEVENECCEIEAEIAQQNKLQGSIRHETGELKKRFNKIKDMVTTHHLSIQKLENEENNLKSRIVRSPDRIKRQMNGIRAALKEKQNNFDSLSSRLHKEQQKIDLVDDSMQDLNKCYDIMKTELEPAIEEYNKKAEESMTVKEQLKSNDLILSDLKNKKLDLERKLRQRQEKLSHLRKQSSRKIDTASQELKFAQQELALVEKDRAHGLERVDEAEKKVLSIKNKMEEDRVLARKEIQCMIDTYKDFESQIVEKELGLIEACTPEAS